MEAAHTLAQPDNGGRLLDSERRCLVTGEVWPKSELIRFVVGPDNVLVPDLAQNLPGRGLWVTADRDCLLAAVRKNLFSHAAKGPVRVDEEIANRVASLLRRRCLDYLGLARRSGIGILGQSQVEMALRARTLSLLLIACDASDKNLRDFMRTPFDGSLIRLFTREELGTALGYDQMVYVGLLDHAITRKLRGELERLDKIARKDHFTENQG